MADQHHNIDKLRMEFILRGQKDDFRFINNIRAVYYSRITKIIDEVMNEFCGEDEHIFFDKIELDLGSISLSIFENKFMDEVFSVAPKVIRRTLNKKEAVQLLLFICVYF